MMRIGSLGTPRASNLSSGENSSADRTIRKRAADFRKRMETQAAGLTTEADEDAFAKFERLKSKVEQAEAEAEALAELRGTSVEQEPPAEEAPEEEVDVAAELAELKKKLKG